METIKKKKKNSNPKDWRPISQITLPGKILEKIIHSQITFYLDVNNILSENQYGFRKNRSTSLAIFEVLKNLYENWNENNFSRCVFIDFSQAFDGIVAEKLELYGFDENSLKFMKNYESKNLTNGGFEKRMKKGIYDTLNGHRLFNMCQMINNFVCMLEYDVLNMFLRFKDKYAL